MLTSTEVMAMLRINRATLCRYCRRGVSRICVCLTRAIDSNAIRSRHGSPNGQFEVEKMTTNVPMSDEQCELWIEAARNLYHLGKLRRWQIRRLEKIPGWIWTKAA
jgi:hypothetical protein